MDEPAHCLDLDRSQPAVRGWVDDAIRKVDADANRSADTHLHVFPLPVDWGFDLSGFVPSWSADDPSVRTDRGSRIEGIGRPRVEPSFVPTVVDRMVSVPDAASIAATR